MRLTIDPRTNIAYLRLSDAKVEATTLEVTETLNVDVGPDGSVLGIEFLDARTQVLSSDDARFLVVHEGADTTREVSLGIEPGPRRARAR